MTDPSPTAADRAPARAGTLRAVGAGAPTGDRIMPWEAISVASAANLIAAAILSVVLAATAGVLVLRQDPVYQSQATLLIDQPSAVTRQLNDGVLVKLSLLRNKYVALATSTRVLVPASQTTGIPLAELAKVRVTAPTNSLLIFAVANGGDRAATQQVANAMADELSKYVTKEQTDAGVAPLDQISLATIRPAGVGVKVRPTAAHARSVALTTAGATALGAYVVLQLVTARRRLPPR